LSKLDRLKEQIAYLKFWQGIMVVTNISLIGWLVSTGYTADGLTLLLAGFGALFLTIGIVAMHRKIDRRIEQTGRL